MKMKRTRVKICGVRDPETAYAAVAAGADAIGFVFAPASPRYIEPRRAASIVGSLPPMVASVGVMVRPSEEEFWRTLETCPTTLTQLHETESVEFVRAVGGYVVTAIRFEAETITDRLALWMGVDEVDAVLVDGSAGGKGESFDWELLAEHTRDPAKPIILAGGLTPANVGRAIATVRPYAVDVSSGVEAAPGVKDPELIDAFCRAVREADVS